MRIHIRIQPVPMGQSRPCQGRQPPIPHIAMRIAEIRIKNTKTNPVNMRRDQGYQT